MRIFCEISEMSRRAGDGILRASHTRGTGVPCSLETLPTYDPTAGLYLGSYSGPRGVLAISYERGMFLIPSHLRRVRCFLRIPAYVVTYDSGKVSLEHLLLS